MINVSTDTCIEACLIQTTLSENMFPISVSLDGNTVKHHHMFMDSFDLVGMSEFTNLGPRQTPLIFETAAHTG